MKIDCPCGNVLRDQTDYLPYKAYFVADQDFEDLLDGIKQQLAEIFTQAAGTPAAADPAQLLGRVLWAAMPSRRRIMYQCRNCGRLCLDDPDDPRDLQWFKPDDDEWKLVLASVREGSKEGMKNLVGHWDPSRSYGRLWFDPLAGEKGGFEEFDDRGDLETRYYELFELLKADGRLAGARLGIGTEGESIRDVHNWSSRQGRPNESTRA
jgi:hypothetical protein